MPIATSSVLGGVKPDGTTITIDEDGTIHGASQGLDFDSLSTAITTGTQSGISITADTENSRFNFEVTNVPTITIDAEGYWTVNGERGENPTKAQGEKGNDGISPTATVVKTATGATITVVSGEQTTTADIENGITTIQTTSTKYTGTLAVDSWVGDTVPYTQTITMDNITADVVADFGIVITKDSVETALEEKKQWGYITSIETVDGGVKFYCFKNKPTIVLNYQMRVV